MMLRRLARLSLLLILLIGFARLTHAQTPAPPPPPAPEYSANSWRRFTSDEGRFSVVFPGTPQSATQKVNPEITLHIHGLQTFAGYSVIYADYPVEVNSMDVAKLILNASVRGAVESAKAELLSVSEITLGNHPGRSLVEKLPDGKIMRVKMILVGSRLYQIAITTPSEDRAPDGGKFYREIATKFLDSFQLTEVANTTAADTAQNTTPGATSAVRSDPVISSSDSSRTSSDCTSTRPNVSAVGSRQTQSGGILNSRATGKLPLPVYPAVAKAARASGAVTIEVIIDEQGKVIWACAVSGHPLLRNASVQAAYAAEFAPTQLEGKPVKVTGVLIYNFQPR